MFKQLAALLSPSGVFAVDAETQRPRTGKYAIYLTDSEANTLRMILSGGARALQDERKFCRGMAKAAYEVADKENKDDPFVSFAFQALNVYKDKVRSTLAFEKRINGVIRAIRNREPV
jgi:hypothetical protein